MYFVTTFLKHVDSNGDVDLYAAFPDDFDLKGSLTSYAHIGQHSAVSLDYIKGSVQATTEESKALLEEIRGIYEKGEDIVITVCKDCFLKIVEMKKV